jgi:SAM-dependent methyltransferase
MKIDHKESYNDFGKQFEIDNDISGIWGGLELLKNIIYPFNLNQIKNKIICEIGIGSGRITNNLIKYKPKNIYCVEPSSSINVVKKNLKSKKLKFFNIRGEDIKFYNKFDYLFSIGVIHHIPGYKKTLKKIHKSLKKNGKFIMWVYGKEGNELYLFIFNNLRKITSILPDFILRGLSFILTLLTYPYGYLCNFFNLPLKKYFLGAFNEWSFIHRTYVIFDQLNPSYSKYFTKSELKRLLNNTGFKIEVFRHRLSYSYTVICSKK